MGRLWNWLVSGWIRIFRTREKPTVNDPEEVRMMSFHIPEDAKFLEMIGAISVAHGHLDYVLRMTIKTLTDVEINEALDATEYEGSAILRKRIRQLARKCFGEGPVLVKLQALMTRCEHITKDRNDLIHQICAKELDGEVKMQGKDRSWNPLPTIEELEVLQRKIMDLTMELNEARLEGFIHEALH